MELYVEQIGEGPAVVLAHGFAGSARNFRPQVRALRGSHRVVVYDAPGHARSPAPEADAGAYTLAAMVSAFASIVDDVAPAPSRAVTGGLSMGAATALLHALDRPDRVRGLVLASLPGGRGAAGSVSAGAAEFASAIETEGLDRAGARFVWGPESGLDPEAGRWVRQGFLEHSPHALAATLRGFLSELPTVAELEPRLRACAVPTLVVAGAEDRGSLEACRRVAGALADARLVVVPDAGHVVNLAGPAEFNAALADFLRELPE